ncbi:MAG: TetR family transcriptional regulator [Gammaproteobacteria bacterium]|jgi:TetR/AcrR family transcriptional repressor of nem operon|nr:TetR family transcriptional regulator [Gammaproteobacteria bacterium]
MSDKRAEILETAVRATKRDGLRKVSFRQLADQVGVKSSSVHYHFPTKADLAESMVRDYTDAFAARLEDIAACESTLPGKIDALVQVFADVLAADDLCLCGMMAAELSTLDARTGHALRQFFRVTEDWLTEQIDMHRQDLRIDLSAKDLGKVILAALEGAILLDRVDRDSERLQAFSRMARAILD